MWNISNRNSYFTRGPLGVMRYHHGVFTKGHLTPILLVNEYLKHRQIDQVTESQILKHDQEDL